MKINVPLDQKATAATKPSIQPSKESRAKAKAQGEALVKKFASTAKKLKIDVTKLHVSSTVRDEAAGLFVHYVIGVVGQVTFHTHIAQTGTSNKFKTLSVEGHIANRHTSTLPKTKVEGTAVDVITAILNAAVIRDRRGAPKESSGGGVPPAGHLAKPAKKPSKEFDDSADATDFIHDIASRLEDKRLMRWAKDTDDNFTVKGGTAVGQLKKSIAEFDKFLTMLEEAE